MTTKPPPHYTTTPLHHYNGQAYLLLPLPPHSLSLFSLSLSQSLQMRRIIEKYKRCLFGRYQRGQEGLRYVRQRECVRACVCACVRVCARVRAYACGLSQDPPDCTCMLLSPRTKAYMYMKSSGTKAYMYMKARTHVHVRTHTHKNTSVSNRNSKAHGDICVCMCICKCIFVHIHPHSLKWTSKNP